MRSRSHVACLRIIILLTFVLAVTGLYDFSPASSNSVVRDLQSPAPPGSLSPRLSALPNGQTLLSWLEPRGEKLANFRYSIRREGKWTAPKSIAEGLPFSRSASQGPGVIGLPGGALIAYWNQAPTGANPNDEEVDVFFSGSDNPTGQWTRPALVNVAETGQENSYSSAAPLDRAQAQLIWLDGRDWETKKRFALVSRTISVDGTMGAETVVDPDTCTCCPTSLVATNFGLLAAYRSHTPANIRDIATVWFANGAWAKPQIIHDDNWHFSACPVNGPSVASNANSVAAAWFTGANEKPALYAAFYDMEKSKFATALRLDLGHPVGRAQTVLPSKDSAVVIWIENNAGVARLLARRIVRSQSLAQPIEIAKGSNFGYPHAVAERGGVLVSWADGGQGSRVHLNEIKFPEP